MGLLDGFSDPTTQGLLGAAGAFFNAGGPSNRPTSFGQALGAGFQGYNNGADAERKRQQEAAMAQGAQQLQQLQIIAQTGTIEQQQMARMQAAKIKSDLIALGQGTGQPGPALMPAAVGAPQEQAMPPIQPGPNSPILPNSQPEWARPQQPFAQQQSAQPAAAPKLTQKNLTQDYANRLLQEAEVYSRNGDFDGADKRYQAASKLLPKVNKIDPGIDPATGKMVNVITFEDGTQKTSEFGVKPDFHPVDQGGKTSIVDYNQVQNGQSFGKSLSPDTAASLAQSERHYQQDQADANAPGKANETLAKQIATYRQPPLGQFNLNKPWGQATMDSVMQQNPEYDAAQYAPRANALKSFAAGGKDGNQIESANTALNHLDTVKKLALAQQNGDVRGFNQIANSIAAQFGGAAPTNLKAAMVMVAPEVIKAVSGVGGTGEERAHAGQVLSGDGTYSPTQVLGSIGTTQELFAGRLREKQRSYERSTKLNDFQDTFLSPAARGILGGGTPNPASSGAGKRISLSDIAITAKNSGKTTAEVTAAARAAGYDIGGQ